MSDNEFSSEGVVFILQLFSATHWTAYINESSFDCHGCESTTFLTNYFSKWNGKNVFQYLKFKEMTICCAVYCFYTLYQGKFERFSRCNVLKQKTAQKIVIFLNFKIRKKKFSISFFEVICRSKVVDSHP